MIDKKAVEIEIIKRKLFEKTKDTRENFSKFFLAVWRDMRGVEYVWNWHHQRMFDFCQSFYRSLESEVAIINIPPGHTKTEFMVTYQAWLIGNDPSTQCINASYAANIGQRNSKMAYEITQTNTFRSCFPFFELNTTKKNKWETNKGGYCIGLGAGGSITGERADAFVIDDPLKPEDAIMATRTELDKINNWLGNTAISRVKMRNKEGKIWRGKLFVIMQRLHDIDLCGYVFDRFEEKFENGKMRQLIFPAIATEDEPQRKKGEALFPQLFPLEFLNSQKEIMQMKGGANYFSAQYQQDPIDVALQEIKSSFFQYYTDQDTIDFTKTIIAVDPAISEKQSSDLRAIAIVSKNNKDQYFVRDCISGRWAANEFIDQLFSVHSAYNCSVVIETIGGQEFLAQMIENEMKTRRQYINLIRIKSRGDKIARLRSTLQPLYSNLRVYHHNKLKDTELENELIRFPKMRHDDCMDAVETAISNLNFSISSNNNYNEKEKDEELSTLIDQLNEYRGLQ